MPALPALRVGDRGEAVRILQQKLADQGFHPDAARGTFLGRTRAAVIHFQQTHLGPDGRPLAADGVVGENTRWALDHPSGAAQRSGLQPSIPEGLTPLRRAQLEIAIAEHAAGVHEEPDGSNWGPQVKKYLAGTPCPWCCYFWSWCNRQCFGGYSLGARYGSVLRAWERAGELGMARRRDGYLPIPGDAFVMLHHDARGGRTGTGHIGFVLRVAERAGSAVVVNTVEGNCGNRVKVGRRELAGADVVGYINNYPPEEQPTAWERGLVGAQTVAGDGDR